MRILIFSSTRLLLQTK